MNLGLSNKVVLVTGASKGIGKAIATNFANERSKIVICSRNIKNLEICSKEIENKTGAIVLPIQANLEKFIEIKNMVKKIINKFQSIDILVNNTGGPPALKFFETDEKYLQHYEAIHNC